MVLGSVVQAAAARAALGGLASLGVDVDALLTSSGVDPRALADPEGYVPLERLHALWRAADEAWTAGPVGVHAAAEVPAGALGELDYLMLSCATGEDVVEALVSYVPIAGTMMDVRRTDVAAGALLELPTSPSRATPIAVLDYRVALLAFRGRALLGSPPASVRFSGRRRDLRGYRRALGCPVTQDHEHDGFIVSRAALRAPTASADPRLHALMRRRCDELLERVPAEAAFVERARRAVFDSLERRDGSLDDVARRLGVSRRTAQRRLAAEGTSFRVLLDEARMELAQAYLAEGRVTMAELGRLLGYSDPAAFHRAFRRWTGSSPARWRDG